MLLSAALLLSAVPASAQDWAKARLSKSPRHQEWVKVKHGGREVQAFVVYPEVKDKAPAVVVIHEIFGMTDWVRLTADELAAAGYIAIAPDLLSGLGAKGGGTEEVRDVGRAIRDLPPDQITADLNACTDYVAQLPACTGHVAVAGFCWGGGQTFRFATNRKDLKAAFVFYGPPPGSKEAIERIQCQVYGFYGGNDARIDATIPRTKELMKEAGKIYRPVVYEGAGHGFMRAGETPGAAEGNRKAREAAWKRWKELLRKI
jgi:carboxymethylenebutenolidase